MSFETHDIGSPKDFSSLGAEFKIPAANPEIENVAPPPIVKVDVNEPVARVIDTEPELEEKMSGIDAYLNNPGNTSIFGEFLAQGTKIGSDLVGDMPGLLNQNNPVVEVMASINGGQEMDVTEQANTWTPSLTPNTPFA